MVVSAALFCVVFVLNVVPAFAPPTWIALSFVGLIIPSVNVLAVAVVGAAAATLGRIALAKLSGRVVRHRFLSEPTRLNIDAIKQGIEGRKALTCTAFMVFALSPLPSNYLFIAYGLTSLPIMLLAVPILCRAVAKLWILGNDGLYRWGALELRLLRLVRLFERLLCAVPAASASSNLRLHAGRLARRVCRTQA